MGKILSIYGVAIIVGCLTGLICSLLMLAIQETNHFLTFMSQFALGHDWPVAVCSIALITLMVFFSWWLTVRFAPEAAGSGIPEIEAALLHKRTLHSWYRLLPVKFVGAVFSIAAKMVLGREGPSVQMGGHLGAMLGDIFKYQTARRDSLIAAGAAAGLAAAFNAPLAGVLFFIEELRQHFNFSFTHFKTVAIACAMSVVVLHAVIGDHPVINMPIYASPDLWSLSTFFLLGLFVGCAGVLFNRCLIKLLNWLEPLTMRQRAKYVVLVGGLVGYLAYSHPLWVSGGYGIIAQTIDLKLDAAVMLGILLIRFVIGLLCYGTGVPGGIFAPILALGTLLGVLICHLFPHAWMDASTQQGMFAVAGMGGLFSATVRAPMTGILLMVEMTQNYSLILPLMVICLTATTVSQLLNNEPIYSQLRNRTKP